MGRCKSQGTTKTILESEFSAFHAALDGGKTTCEESVRQELENIRSYNRELNAFITVLDGEKGFALSRARALDALVGRAVDGGKMRDSRRRQTRAVGIFGIPLAIKDNFSLGGFPTTGATYYF